MKSWSELNPFREKPVVQQQQQQQAPVKKEGEQQQQQQQQQQSDDPMDKIESLWQPNKNEKGEEIVVESEDNSPYLPQFDQKKFAEMMGKMDFTKGISGEEWKAIKEGGDGAQAAFASVMNKVGRGAFNAAMTASMRMTEAGFASAKGRFTGGVPDLVRDFMTESGISDSISIAKDPAFAPLVKNVKSQYLAKFPKASPSEVNGAVKKYFDALQKKLAGSQTDKTVELQDNATKLRKGAPDADFGEWLGEDMLQQLMPEKTENDQTQ